MNKHRAGFTIVELVVTMVVTGLIVAAVSALFITINSAQRSARLTEIATRAAESQIESLRNNYYGSLEPGSTITFTDELPPALPMPRSGAAVISEPETDMRQVDVTVSFRDGSREKTIKLRSVLGQLGIGQ